MHLYSGRKALSTIYRTMLPTRERAHPCAGNTRLWRKTPRENTCRSMRMSAVLIFSIRDLCMIEHVSGIDASQVLTVFKIEGRMKTALYVATVARTYRRAMVMTEASRGALQGIWRGIRSRFQTVPTGSLRLDFLLYKPSTKARFTTITPMKSTYLGIVGERNEEGLYRIEQRNKFSVGRALRSSRTVPISR